MRLQPNAGFAEAAFVSCPGSADDSCYDCVRKPRRRWMGMRSAWPLLVAMHGQHRCANWRAIEARHMGSLPITQNAIVQMLRLALVNFYVGFVPLPVTVGKRLSLA